MLSNRYPVINHLSRWYMDLCLQLVNLIVEPSAEEVRVSEQKQLKQAETKKERNERRRQARSKKGATATETEFEVDTSDVDDYVEDEPIVLSGSRESMERQIFGALTSSSDSSTPVTIQFQVTCINV